MGRTQMSAAKLPRLTGQEVVMSQSRRTPLADERLPQEVKRQGPMSWLVKWYDKGMSRLGQQPQVLEEEDPQPLLPPPPE